jgi:methoxymalonate biosynthesis acyl carrier protein
MTINEKPKYPPEHARGGKMLDMNGYKSKIRTFLLPFIQNRSLADEQDMFALGLVNSLFAMQLVLFVEREFAITVENEDLDIANFQSIDAIAHMVSRKLDGGRA